MKNKIIFLTCILVLTFTARAQAGSETGNGGAAIACRDPQGKLTRVDLLDLFEGFALFGRGYTELNLDPKDQARNFIPTIDALFAGVSPVSLEDNLESIMGRLKILPDDVGLSSTEDWGNFIVPKNCSIAQAVNFRDDGDIFADAEIWNQFSKTQKAAAYIHELIYDYARENGEELTSVRVRTLVSLLFASVPLDPIRPAVAQGFCHGQDNEFYILGTPGKKMELYFTKIRGHVTLTRTTAKSVELMTLPLFSSELPAVAFESPIDSYVDRGAVVRFEFNQVAPELMVKMGTKKMIDKLTCEEIKN